MNSIIGNEKILKPQREKIEPPGRPAGISRSRKMIATENAKEIQFMRLCKQIRLDDYKRERADNQRSDRISKRRRFSE